ncbi:MAG: HAD family hydrolase [Eubacteriales bacterium]|nr:HAD family hydrolase [Lachnospiraceae bacterium]MDO5127793.1 HAD family hydrolase [Eubacteriales bacterium]
MKYKLIIFDMDGTTLYTIEDLTNSLNFALNKSKLPTRSLPEVLRFVGNGIRKLIERAVPDGSSEETIETVHANFTEHYTIHCADTTRPYDGIIKLLKTLKEKGILTAIVSNKADYAVQALCKDYFPNLFDAVAGEKQDVRKKPAPDMVNNILKSLNLTAHDAVYIGDSEVDIQTAKNSNMDCIAVDWGFRTREDLIQAGANVIVSTPDEILGKIE